MKSRTKIFTTDCLAAVLFLALLLLPLWLQHTPMFVQVPVAIIILCLGVYFLVSALRGRWRLSQRTGQFLGYYFRLVAVAIVIIVAFLLLCFVIGR